MIITYYSDEETRKIEWDINDGIPEEDIIDNVKKVEITSKEEFIAIHRSFHDLPKCKFGVVTGIDSDPNNKITYYGDMSKFILGNLDAIEIDKCNIEEE